MKKQKSISQLQIEYSRLYDSSEGRNYFDKENEKILDWKRKVKEL